MFATSPRYPRDCAASRQSIRSAHVSVQNKPYHQTANDSSATDSRVLGVFVVDGSRAKVHHRDTEESHHNTFCAKLECEEVLRDSSEVESTQTHITRG